MLHLFFLLTIFAIPLHSQLLQTTEICTGDTNGDCSFDCRFKSCTSKIMVCTNTVKNCLFQCGASLCKGISVEMYSGATESTIIDCYGKDSCIEASIFVGDISDSDISSLLIADSITSNSFSAAEHGKYLLDCGDNSCVKTQVSVTGSFKNHANVNANSYDLSLTTNFKSSYLECSLSSSNQLCTVDCGPAADTCKEVKIQCNSGLCSCKGPGCVVNGLSQVTVITTSPTKTPSKYPTRPPSITPSKYPTSTPSKHPSESPSKTPTIAPSGLPSLAPTKSPSSTPTKSPTKVPTSTPSKFPTKTPSASPTFSPSKTPTQTPSSSPTVTTNFPTIFPSKSPTKSPSKFPSKFPTVSPSKFPTSYPTNFPTFYPSRKPTFYSRPPSFSPTVDPTIFPSSFPSFFPSFFPSGSPTFYPSKLPSTQPTTGKPTETPSFFPSKFPSTIPTKYPTQTPSYSTSFPSEFPSGTPTDVPTEKPSKFPTRSSSPTKTPTAFRAVKIIKYEQEFNAFSTNGMIAILVLVFICICGLCLCALLVYRGKVLQLQLSEALSVRSSIHRLNSSISTVPGLPEGFNVTKKRFQSKSIDSSMDKATTPTMSNQSRMKDYIHEVMTKYDPVHIEMNEDEDEDENDDALNNAMKKMIENNNKITSYLNESAKQKYQFVANDERKSMVSNSSGSNTSSNLSERQSYLSSHNNEQNNQKDDDDDDDDEDIEESADYSL